MSHHAMHQLHLGAQGPEWHKSVNTGARAVNRAKSIRYIRSKIMRETDMKQ